MDLRFSERERAFREQCRAWLRANVPEDKRSGDTAEGFAAHLAWERALFDAGWAVVSWPREYGGREASLVEWLIFEEEYYLSGAPPRVTQNGIFLLAPSLFEYGTPAQKARWLTAMASGEFSWAQAWSEPNAGSDLANQSARAERVEGGWRLTGQKTWTTRGAYCQGIYGLFRTDPTAVRHRGLTYFLVDLERPGITVRPVERLDGDEGFAEVFLEGVFVPDDAVLGEVNQGWKVAMTTTSSERGLTLRSPGRFLAAAERLAALYRELGEGADPGLRARVAQAWMDAQAYRLHTYQTVARMMSGEAIGAESSLTKVFWSELDIRLHEAAMDLLGEAAAIEYGAAAAPDGGAWTKGYQFALAGPIYAGTNEIQRNLIAKRVLGLPREKRR
jgi:alkylation response protein AidB-like acyl-CoA dehydrogenase